MVRRVMHINKTALFLFLFASALLHPGQFAQASDSCALALGKPARALSLRDTAVRRILWREGTKDRPYRLFSGREQTAYYDEIVSALKVGDYVQFSDGSTFRLTKYLGEGNTTAIWAIDSQWAIRIPLKQGFFAGGTYTYTDYINSFIDGWDNVSALSPEIVVKLDYQRSSRGEYAVVERLDLKFKPFSLKEWLDPLQRRQIAAEQLQKGWIEIDPTAPDPIREVIARINDQLVEFFENTYPFIYIGDFRPGQLLFSHRGWVIDDLTDVVYRARNSNDASLVHFSEEETMKNAPNAPGELDSRIGGLEQNVFYRAREAILQRRQEAGFKAKHPSWAKRFIRWFNSL